MKLQKYKYNMEATMDNEHNMDMEQENMDEIIVMTDDDGNEYELHVLASKEGENCFYLLTALEDEDNDAAEVLLFKCATTETTSVSDEEEELPLELVDETHEDFERVMELFKPDYEELGIIFDEEDSPLAGQEE